MMTALAYLLIGVFVVAERLLRRDDAARSLDLGAADRGTTYLIGAAFGLALNGGLIVVLLRRGRDPGRTLSRRVGLLAMIVGLVLRVWSARTLGRYYTRTLKVAPDQTVVREGPYRLIRHPGYLADLILWIGFGLALASRILLAAIVASTGVAYSRRMAAEETMLVEQLGAAYREYQKRTWRLLPGVF